MRDDNWTVSELLIRLSEKWATRIYGCEDGTELDEALTSAMREAFRLGEGSITRGEIFEIPACPLGCEEHSVCVALRKDK